MFKSEKSIWDFKKGDKLKVVSGPTGEVVTPTEDGQGLVVTYLDGDLKGQQDFVFEDEIDFKSNP